MANKLPRIALVVPNLPLGGGVPAVAAFIKDVIVRSGRYEIKVISLSSASDDIESALLTKPATWFRGPIVSEKEWHGLPVHHVGAWLGELEFMRYQPRQILTSLLADCDLVQVVCGSPAWANPVLGLGKPVSVQCATLAKVERRRRDLAPSGLSGYLRKAMTTATDHYDRNALRLADAVQVENPWMLEYCQSLPVKGGCDLRYAPPGVDVEKFSPISERLNRPPYILCVARLSDPRKNVELLLEAYAILPDSVKNRVRLKLAGSCGPPEHFWRRAEALGLSNRIDYVVKPTLEELAVLYQQTAVFALPSDEEGLGVVILEAMACGVPVVSTRSGGPDGIITDGTDGFLTPLDEATTMAERLCRLLEDDRLNAAMGNAARQTIMTRYADAVAGEAFVDTWKKLLSKQG